MSLVSIIYSIQIPYLINSERQSWSSHCAEQWSMGWALFLCRITWISVLNDHGAHIDFKAFLITWKGPDIFRYAIPLRTRMTSSAVSGLSFGNVTAVHSISLLIFLLQFHICIFLSYYYIFNHCTVCGLCDLFSIRLEIKIILSYRSCLILSHSMGHNSCSHCIHYSLIMISQTSTRGC